MSTIFDHLRSDDGEHVGYIEVVDDLFVPHDLLHRRRGEPMELDEAEAVLDAVGLRALAEDWLLDPTDGIGEPLRVRIQEVTRTHVTVAPTVDGAAGEVAKRIDPAASVTLALPTDRLCPVE
ncbi:hypothetical protein FM125_11020 [Micrococcus lylae]|uniref:Uncharacterized protein n=1 Tax=Micrococcus lylae TaxID=1273 RepID=A0A1R4JX39_9MICC|nr:serine/threonine protein phosphatase [Micrococcus lylae]SJN36313.1 hypothetical protein FM125_11020 [Micrococcus lylae]